MTLFYFQSLNRTKLYYLINTYKYSTNISEVVSYNFFKLHVTKLIYMLFKKLLFFELNSDKNKYYLFLKIDML